MTHCVTSFDASLVLRKAVAAAPVAPQQSIDGRREYAIQLPITEAIDDTLFYSCCADEDFTEPVWLPGWDEQSLWGADLGRFFVQLRRNDASVDEPPYLWITAADRPPLARPGCVALAVVNATGADPLSAAKAIQILPPPPPPEFDIAAIADRQLAAARQLSSSSTYTLGQINAYEWVLGRRETCPGSDHSWPTEFRQVLWPL